MKCINCGKKSDCIYENSSYCLKCAQKEERLYQISADTLHNLDMEFLNQSLYRNWTFGHPIKALHTSYKQWKEFKEE